MVTWNDRSQLMPSARPVLVEMSSSSSIHTLVLERQRGKRVEKGKERGNGEKLLLILVVVVELHYIDRYIYIDKEHHRHRPM